MSAIIGFETSLGSEIDPNDARVKDRADLFIPRTNLRNFTAISPVKLHRAIGEKNRAFGHRSQEDLDRDVSFDGFSDNKSEIGAKDCYEEIDERMSRNSFEYPEQQAKYVDRWLDDMRVSRSGSNWSLQDCGNVIGIRGFSGCGSRTVSRRGKDSSAYVRLKLEHAKLLREFVKLNGQSEDKVGRLNNIGGSRCSRGDHVCHYPHRQVEAVDSTDILRREIASLKEKLETSEREHKDIESTLRAENEKLRNLIPNDHELTKEVDALKSQLRAISSEPKDRLLMILKNENARLKDLAEVDILEFEAMRENYCHLESQVRSLIIEQQKIDKEKNEENAQLLTELCRLQVYQPKLEMILETERSIKAELQKKIETLKIESNQMKELIDKMSRELNNVRMRSKKFESVELEKLQIELSKWQDNYYRMVNNKSDMENLLRASRSKIAQLDAEYQTKLDHLSETRFREIDESKQMILRLEEENRRCNVRIETADKNLLDCHLENQRLTRDITDLQSKIVNQGPSDATLKRLEISEQKIDDLKRQIDLLNTQNGELIDSCESLRLQLEQGKKHIEQLNQRIHLQQRAYDDLREKKDQELAKLKTNLNFEQYNRQVALKGIEKELRASLKELDAVKYRFSRRLVPGETNAKTTTNRVRFCEPQNDDMCPSKDNRAKE